MCIRPHSVVRHISLVQLIKGFNLKLDVINFELIDINFKMDDNNFKLFGVNFKLDASLKVISSITAYFASQFELKPYI